MEYNCRVYDYPADSTSRFINARSHGRKIQGMKIQRI